ncbi:hypothetical protein OEZ86_008611 [Tetradesmus obliquus]|nr:hypothetical protein OEZ86_008611 [Tetradesmus obliquus]
MGALPAAPAGCGCLEPLETIRAPNGQAAYCTINCNYYGICYSGYPGKPPPDIQAACAIVNTIGWQATRICAKNPGSFACRIPKTSAAFKSEASLQQLLLQLYNLGAVPAAYATNNASQTPGGVNLLPRVRRQGRCGTCVAHAIAAGIEAALGASLQQDPRSFPFSISAGSIYFCSKGGRTCDTGWQIQPALQEVMDGNFELLRPSKCTAGTFLEDTDKQYEVSAWQQTCAAVGSKACPAADRGLPWVKCSFSSLSSFW